MPGPGGLKTPDLSRVPSGVPYSGFALFAAGRGIVLPG